MKPLKETEGELQVNGYSQKFHCHLRIISSRAKSQLRNLDNRFMSGMYQIQIKRISTFVTMAK